MSAIDPTGSPVPSSSPNPSDPPAPSPAHQPQPYAPLDPYRAYTEPDPMQPNATPCNLDRAISSPSFTHPEPRPDLDPRQLAAIALLTAGKTTAAVAKVIGVHRTTIYRWKVDPDFAGELDIRRSELRDTIDARLHRILLHATQAALASLKTRDPDRSHRNAFRLLSTLRPWMPHLTAPRDPHD